MIRVTIAMSYRSGSEVLLHDSGPLLSVRDALSAFEAIADALDGNANQITMGGGQLVVRIVSRSFDMMLKHHCLSMTDHLTPFWSTHPVPERARSAITPKFDIFSRRMISTSYLQNNAEYCLTHLKWLRTAEVLFIQPVP